MRQTEAGPLGRSIAMVSVLLGMLPAGCGYESGRDESSHYYSVKQGSRLVLNRTLTIAPNQVAVYLQHGEVKPHDDIDFYYPNCKFELYSISEEQRRVVPDTFRVSRVVDERNDVSLGYGIHASLAGAALSIGDAPQVYTYATVMYLESALQPDVFRISCQHQEDVFIDQYLSIEQMREAMGGVFTLEPAAPQVSESIRALPDLPWPVYPRYDRLDTVSAV